MVFAWSEPSEWYLYCDLTMSCKQINNNIFVNPSAIKTKIAGKLVDDADQISSKTKLLIVKLEQNPP